MKIGFLTGIMGDLPLEDKIVWAKKVGFETLEVSCWPKTNSRDYSGSDIDVENFTSQEAEKLNKTLKDNGMTISALAYYDNNIDGNLELRKKYNTHLKKVIDAASLLGVENVGTFIGRNFDKTIEESFDDMEEVFKPLLEYAKIKNVRIMIENCSMPGWHESGWAGTISYSPELWEEMFRRLDYDNFGLNFDPSHLIWLGIDYLWALKEFKNKIFQVHAKDTIIFKEKINYFSILGKQLNRGSSWDLGFWQHRMPGRGDIDWSAFLETLKEIGYDKNLVIEHEDPEYEGTIEKVKDGLSRGYKFLKNQLEER